MFEYTIAAIPTVYNGVQYRSRLEARWAAFFDLLGWRHTYEPYDMGAWSPDFLVRLNAEYGASVLIEVKPIETCCETTLQRMWDACSERSIFTEDTNIVAAILIGVSPLLTNNSHYNSARVGWQISNCIPVSSPTEVGIGWVPCIETPEMLADFVHVDFSWMAWFSTMGGDVERWNYYSGPGPRAYPNHAMDLWKRACNAVQWLGKGA